MPAMPAVHTHHCLCANLVLATTYDISSLPKRSAPSLDRATILPCPAPPQDWQPPTENAPEEAERNKGMAPGEDGLGDYTRLCSVSIQSRQGAVIVRRDDGFETRWLVRCARCRLVLGYYLDWSQFAGGDAPGDEETQGRREDVLYLLPGAVTTTEDMSAGKRPAEGEVNLGLEDVQ